VKRNANKRGAGAAKVNLTQARDAAIEGSSLDPVDLIALDTALQSLERSATVQSGRSAVLRRSVCGRNSGSFVDLDSNGKAMLDRRASLFVSRTPA
jgi:hypothetical protein